MTHSPVSVEQEHLLKAFRLFGVSVLLCGILFGVDQIGFVSNLRGGVERGFLMIDTEVIRLRRWIYQPVDWVVASQNRALRLASLEQRLAQTSVSAERLAALESQVKSLEALAVHTTPDKKAERIASLIDYGDRMVVAVGAGDSVHIGQVVTDENGVLLGRILHIGSYLSEITALSDVGSFVQVQTVTGGTRGIVEGAGGKAVLTGVLQTETLSVGDILVTSGTNTLYPPGLVVGQVTALTGNPQDVTKGGTVELLAHPSDWVALW